VELRVRLAVAAGAQACGEQTAGFVAVDGAAATARHVAVAGMDLDRRPSDADAEFDDPVRRPRTAPSAALLFGLAPLESSDLAVDAMQPHGVPHAQGVQALQIGRQVIEHIFDSRP
jgi:hypothetical protein